MKKRILKIAITGGPCGGKSTGMDIIDNIFTRKGWKVIIVPETATELMNAGIKPLSNGLSNMAFQNILLKTQLHKENMYIQAAELFDSDKVLILHDRGALDGKAYMTQDEFSSLLKKEKLNETKLRDNYDAVFHLITAANGAETFYTLSNNKVRTESIEEARMLDDKIINSWVGHPHFKIIDNSTDFNAKMDKLANEVCSLIGEPMAIKVQRKYLVSMPNINNLYKECSCNVVDIMQTYLMSDDKNTEKRIRQRGIDGDYVYTLTENRRISSLETMYTGKIISQEEYLSLMMNADTSLHQISKKRYCFVHDHKSYELDIYPFSNKEAILEITLTDKIQKIIIPNFINLIKEVTHEQAYKNYELARTLTL